MRCVTCFNIIINKRLKQVDSHYMILLIILCLTVNIDLVASTSVPSIDFMINRESETLANFDGTETTTTRSTNNEINTTTILTGDHLNHLKRSKRGVIQLAGMISCVAGCDPLIYKGYGCYCGYSGRGTPVDGIDRCCMKHDHCYTRTGCSSFKQYALSYSYDCITRGFASCEAAYAEGSCAVRLCRCDLKFAHCLSAYHCPMGRKTCPSSKLRSIFALMMPVG